jgi:hypothetical protein
MSLYSSGIQPDPNNAVDVLAFVLCPIGVFAPTGDEDELAAVAEMIAPAKAEAARRWHEAHMASLRN